MTDGGLSGVRPVNSWRHAVSSARKWGGSPEDYLKIHEFIDSSKKVVGDVRHRALYHHTLGVWLCQEIFGPVLSIARDDAVPDIGEVRRYREVPVREIAERHILEDLGWLPSPADYLKNTPIELWMSGSVRREVPLSRILGDQRDSATEMSLAEAEAIITSLAKRNREELNQ